MNSKKAALILVILMSVGSAAAATCTNATLTGVYGITFAGINASGQPTAAVAQVTSDGNGNLTGVETKSKGGVIFLNLPVTATYQIAKNCTGSGTWTAQGGDTRHYNLVVASGGKAMELIQTDAGRIESGLAQAQGTATCTNAAVKKTFAVWARGAFIGVGPVAVVGQMKLNGAGSITGSATLSLDGQIVPSVPISGTYQINSDCTGTASFTPQGQATMDVNLVIVNSGKGMVLVETDTNTAVGGSLLQ